MHGSFPKDGALPHISVYENETKQTRNLYVRRGAAAVGLRPSDRGLLLSTGLSATIVDAFILAVYRQHLALNPPAKMNSASAQSTGYSMADFPALPSVAETPVAHDPLMAQLDALPDSVRSALMNSGAFD